MKKQFVLLMMVVAGAAGLQAQNNPLSAELKRFYDGNKTNIMRSAEKMPEAEYSFKPVDTVRPFSGEVGHAAEWAMNTCAWAKGETPVNPAAGKTSKADLIAALKQAFDYCDPLYNSLTDADATKMVKAMGGRDMTKFSVLWFNVMHNNETYGTMVPYLRIKGIVPPSSEPRPAEKKQ
ncbi:MAG: DinB family protein [Bryobacteraceae bacterium]